ncbi:hypothetical protein Tsubulata_015033 [Turnera subulata]|uniref:F-box domain-containing protein n=1 Tax=Turnera subulata TaxID=218843 RepID=A0A9Q0J1N0_9ROSI|nr:hypothetical protein Tsubulata_015033 [Turnera subulata]
MGSGKLIEEDMVEEILLRLPVESLLRFKSASRHWLGLISSSRFATAHHRRHSTNPKNCLLFYAMKKCKRCHQEEDWARSSDETGPGVTLISEEEEGVGIRAVDMDLPPLRITSNYGKEKGKTIVGCAMGLVCIRSDREGMENYLWNPATRQYRRLPTPLFAPPVSGKHSDSDAILGFGCTVNEDDCKLLRIVPTYTKYGLFWWASIAKAEVFSLTSGCWTEVVHRDVVCERYKEFTVTDGYVVLKGVLYRLVRSPTASRLIQTFDFEDEVFGSIDTPPRCYADELVVYKESLALLKTKGARLFGKDEVNNIEMWVLKEEEGNGNPHRRWTKLFTCQPPGSHFPKALGNWGGSETLVLFQDARRPGVEYTCDDPHVLYLYDPLLQKVKRYITAYKRRMFAYGARCYVPSLVSVYAQHEVNSIPDIVPPYSRFDFGYEPPQLQFALT